MMKTFAVVVRVAFLASPFLVGAMSIDTASAAPSFEHSVYPGSNSASAQQERSKRDAPNMYCEKHENYCN